MNQPNLHLRRAVLTALALSATSAIAQDAADQEGARNIEHIVVTAQKREQNLQDVPIVVTAVSEQLLQDTGVKDIKDLTLVAPGLTVTSTSSEASTTARIRGIGTVGDNPGLESSVGIVIDGVYRPRNGVGFGDLGELERIEVLKGPQGTLFGKNTSAGVINVVTKKPSFDFSSQVELTAGDYGAMEGSASITGPMAETLAGRLYVAARERDGYLDVLTGTGPRTETEDVDRSVKTARGQLLLKPSDTLEIRLTGDYAEREENCCAGVQLNIPTGATGIAAVLNALSPNDTGISNPVDPYARVAFSNRSTAQDTKDVGASAEINWDSDLGTLTSVTGWREWEVVQGQDTDYTTVDIWYRDFNGQQYVTFEQMSQEFRLAGETDRLNWLVGAFYANEDLDNGQLLQYGTQFRQYLGGLLTGTPLAPGIAAMPFTPGTGQVDTQQQDSETWALFTNNNFRITDALELTVGLRYTNESKDLESLYTNTHTGEGCRYLRQFSGFIPNGAGRNAVYGIGCLAFTDPTFNNLANSQSLDESEWSGTAKLAYRFTDELMAYGSYARGYKAGGFNLDRERNGTDVIQGSVVTADLDTSFAKELVDSYEIGLKTQWLDNSLLLNGTVFYQDYTDFQLNTFNGLQFIVTSVPQVVSQGVDVDVVWYTPLEQLSLQGGVTYAETTIEDFGTATATFRPDRADDRLSFAPEWSSSLSATFDQPIGSNLLFRANIGAKYTSEYNTGSNLDQRKIQDAFTLVNARLGFGAEDERWMVEAWAQNLTDEEYVQVAFDAPLQGSSTAVPNATSIINAFLGAPRTYGVTARFKF